MIALLCACYALQGGPAPAPLTPIDSLGRVFPIGAGFGTALDVEQDDLFVSAPFGGPAGPPAVYRFDGSGGAWTFEELILPNDPQLDYSFGKSIALDGNVLAVGASYAGSSGPPEIGRAYVFENNGEWQQTALLQPPAVSGSQRLFGESISLSGDNLAVGYYTTPGSGRTVLVYERTGSNWNLAATLFDGATLQTFYGQDLCLDGNTLLVGARWDSPGGLVRAGSVFVYERIGTTWTQTTKLAPSDLMSFDEFGQRVALEGDLAAVSSESDSSGTADGSVYVFQRTGSIWSQIAKLTASSGLSADEYGDDIALAGGAVYARAWDDSIYVSRPFGSSYVEQARLLLDVNNGSFNSGPIAVGATAVFAGDAGDSSVVQGGGSVQIFPSLDAQAYCSSKLSSQACLPTIQTTGSVSVQIIVPFLVEAHDVINNKPGLLFYGTSGPFSVPFLGGTLCVAPPVRRTLPMASGGNPPPEDCSGVLTMDFNAYLRSGVDPMLVVGDQVWAQYWYRDPNDTDGVGLSDGVTFLVLP